MMDWLGRLIDLPREFLSCSESSKGGGVIQSSAAEATLVALLSAKARAVKRAQGQHPDWKEADIVAKLVGYTSSNLFLIVSKAFVLSVAVFCLFRSIAFVGRACGFIKWN